MHGGAPVPSSAFFTRKSKPLLRQGCSASSPAGCPAHGGAPVPSSAFFTRKSKPPLQRGCSASPPAGCWPPTSSPARPVLPSHLLRAPRFLNRCFGRAAPPPRLQTAGRRHVISCAPRPSHLLRAPRFLRQVSVERLVFSLWVCPIGARASSAGSFWLRRACGTEALPSASSQSLLAEPC